MKNEKPISEETRSLVRNMWQEAQRKQEADIIVKRQQAQAEADLIAAETKHNAVVEDPVEAPLSAMTINKLLTRLHDLKANAFNGNGDIPIRVHMPEQDQVSFISSIAIDMNSANDGVLIFCDDPIAH